MGQLINLLEAGEPFIFAMSGAISIEMVLDSGSYSIASNRIYLNNGINMCLPIESFSFDDDQGAWLAHVDGLVLKLEGFNG